MSGYPPGWVVNTIVEGWIPNEDGTGVRASYIQDNFVTPENPIVSPRTCEPGPGSIEIFGNAIGGGSQWWIDCNERLSVTPPSPANWGDAYFYGANNLLRRNGLFAGLLIHSGQSNTFSALGLASSQGSTYSSLSGTGLYFNGLELWTMKSSGPLAKIGDVNLGVDYQCIVLARDPGSLIAIRGGAFTNWTILWVDDSGVDTELYPSYWVFDQNGYVDRFEASVSELFVPLFYDDFNRPDSTRIGDVCGGLGWTTSGTWAIVNNRLQGTGVNNSEAIVDSGITDAVITCISQASAGAQGLIVRRTNNLNYFKVQYKIGSSFEIEEVVGGVPQPPLDQTTPTSIPANTDLRIEVVLEGDQIVAYLDGENRISGTMVNNLAATEVGVFKDTTQDVQFDDFYVWPRTLETI